MSRCLQTPQEIDGTIGSMAAREKPPSASHMPWLVACRCDSSCDKVGLHAFTQPDIAISLVRMQDIPAVSGNRVSLAQNHSSLNQTCERRACVKRTSAGLSVAFSRMLRAPRRKVAKCSKCDLARAQRLFALNRGAPLIDGQTEAVSTSG